jgi:glyoxylase-like metal-dependent hydrolase (beta-lactamase superfamily II)
LHDWHVESGTFELLVGASSRDIRLSATVEMKSSQAQAPAVDRQALAAYYDFPKGAPVSQADFENLLGRAAPGNEIIKGEPYTLNTPLEDMQDSFIGRQLLNLMSRQMQNMVKDDPDSPTAYLMQAVFKEAPLRTMLMFGGGAVSREMLDALLLMVNGKSFKGSFELVKAIRAAKSTGEPGEIMTSETVVQIPLNAWVNVFLLRGEDGAVLVDTGIAGQEDLILERLAEHGVKPQDVRLILITHGHGDHVGSAAALRERTGAPIAIHALDADMLRHADQPQEFPPDSNKLLLALSRLPIMQYAGLEPLEPDITFEYELDLSEYGVAGRVIHTPGHSPGSVTVLLESGAAIIGDMVMGRISKQMREPGPPFIAHDLARNRESIRQILELGPHPIYASHGGPFDDISPALAEGGVSLRRVGIALGAVLGLALLWKLLRRK